MLKKHIQLSCVKTPPAVARENSYGYSCYGTRPADMCQYVTLRPLVSDPLPHGPMLSISFYVKNQTLKTSNFCSKKRYNLSKTLNPACENLRALPNNSE